MFVKRAVTHFRKKSVINKTKTERLTEKSLLQKKEKRWLGECGIVLIVFGQNMKMRSKRREAKNCLSSENVNLCLLDSVESIAQGIKIL